MLVIYSADDFQCATVQGATHPERYHAISPEVPCPSCGRPGLTFMRKRPIGDLYTCTACGRTTVHHRSGVRTGGADGCGLRVLLGALEYGPWRPCVPPAGKCSSPIQGTES